MMKNFSLNWYALQFLLKTPKLWKYVIWPLLISFLLMVGLIFGIYSLMNEYMSWEPSVLTENASYWESIKHHFLQFTNSFSGWLKWILLVVISLVLVWYSFGIIASIILIPFLELLSCQVEVILRGKSAPDNPWYTGILSSFLFSSSFAILKLLFTLVSAIICIFFPFFIVVSFLVIAWFASLEALDLNMSRRLFSVSQKLGFLKQRTSQMLSLGAFSSLLLMVPILQVFQPIIAACAGTFLWVKETNEYGLSEEFAYLKKGG